MDDLSAPVAMCCPTCGRTEFKDIEPGSDEGFTDNWPITCAHCGRSFSRAELIEANGESINATIQDMDNVIFAAAAKELEKTFKKQGWRIK